MARSHRIGSRAHQRIGIALIGTMGVLAAGMTAFATPAAADPGGTIILASGTSATSTGLWVLDASPSYVLFEQGTDSPRVLRTVTAAGGSAVTLSSQFGSDDDPRLVGSLVTAPARDEATDSNALDFQNADGTGFGTIDLPSGYKDIYQAGSSNGGYVWSRNADDKTIEVGILATSGSVTDLGALPFSAHQAIDQASSDESGLLVAYRDANCDVTAEDVVFVPADGDPIVTLFHPASCSFQYTWEVSVGGGEAAWHWYDGATSSNSVRYVATTGGPVQSTTTFNDSAFDSYGLVVTNSVLAEVARDGQIVTVPLTGGASTSSSYVANASSGLASLGTTVAFKAVTSVPANEGLWTTPSAGTTPTQIFTDGFDPILAQSVAMAPGRVGYEDNATPDRPIFTRTLTRSDDDTLSAGPESLLASSGTGFGLSLSGTRAAYVDGSNLRLRSGASVKTLAASRGELSGRRVLVPSNAPSGYSIYDDVTSSSTAVPGSTYLGDAKLWGNYVVALGEDGVIRRIDLSTGVTQVIFTISHQPGDDVGGGIAVWGNTIAWAPYICPDDGPCSYPGGSYVTVAPGSSPGTPTTFNTWSSGDPVLSNGYVGFLGTADDDANPMVVQPLSGGSPITLTQTACLDLFPHAAIDNSIAAWLDCPTTAFASAGTPKAAPLPHVANPPWFLGDPQAPSVFNNPGVGTWDSDFVTSAALTSCTVSISLGATTIRTLPCDNANMALGEATASWDGKNTGGTTVSPGVYTWKLNASNADGSLRNYNGSATPVTGTISVNVTLPGAPTAVTATGGGSQATVSWTAPANNGGTPITGYDVQYSSNSGSTWTSASSTFHTSTATSQTVTGLTNGTSYVFRVAAINAVGTGPYSAASSAVTIGQGLAAPTNVTATAGNAQAVVSWTAPASNGGSPVTGYDVQYSSNGGSTWTSASSAFHTSTATTQTVTGLTNGTSYVFRVAAINAGGTGPYSAASASVMPGIVPGAPTNLTAVAGAGSATLSWTAPADQGTSAITNYVVQRSTDGGTTWQSAIRNRAVTTAHEAPATSRTITGLTNGVSYTFRVAATNATGTGAYSTASNAVTPTVGEGQAQLTLGGAHAIDIGNHLTLRTTLTDGAGPIGKASVQLYARHGSSPWALVTTGVTDSLGHERSVVTPTRNTRYEWRFAGDTTHGPAISPVRNVTVRQTVAAHAAVHHVRRDGETMLYGTVHPKSNGRVYLQQRKHGRWHTMDKHAALERQVMPDGTHRTGFVMRLTVHHLGKHHYRVHRPVTGRNGAGNSRTITVRCT